MKVSNAVRISLLTFCSQGKPKNLEESRKYRDAFDALLGDWDIDREMSNGSRSLEWEKETEDLSFAPAEIRALDYVIEKLGNSGDCKARLCWLLDDFSKELKEAQKDES